MFSGSLFTIRFNAHCQCVDAWINAGKSNGFDATKKKKKKDARRELEGTKREGKSKEEDKNCGISQITTWHVFISCCKRHVFISWCKSSVLHQLQTEFKTLEIKSLFSQIFTYLCHFYSITIDHYMRNKLK